jgi:hypothetical protein
VGVGQSPPSALAVLKRVPYWNGSMSPSASRSTSSTYKFSITLIAAGPSWRSAVSPRTCRYYLNAARMSATLVVRILPDAADPVPYVARFG